MKRYFKVFVSCLIITCLLLSSGFQVFADSTFKVPEGECSLLLMDKETGGITAVPVNQGQHLRSASARKPIIETVIPITGNNLRAAAPTYSSSSEIYNRGAESMALNDSSLFIEYIMLDSIFRGRIINIKYSKLTEK